MFYKDESLAVFIDGSSTWSAARAQGLTVDYTKLRAEFAKRGRLVRCYYYTPIDETGDFSSVRRLTDFLSYNGFTLRTRQTRETENSSGFRQALSYLHMQLAMDAMSLVDKIHHAVIMSGDGEMSPLIQELQRRGMRVTVCSTRSGAEGSMISDEIRRVADGFIDIGDLREVISLERDAA
ncbi:NYN domain-containing protein [Loktanella sp. DJP18]|uniref:LabA-like NYN domain-containing protein n=1 Tax=Loktanella sp. DJP18 TaxID=3409788 RepID=UPI003BB703A0